MEQEYPKTAVFHGMVSITGLSGFFENKSLQIRSGDIITIGRDRAHATLLFPPDQDHISAMHCELIFDSESGRLDLKDSDSKNGTFLGNGQRLEPGIPYEIKDNDTFYVAEKENMFLVRIY